MHTTHSFFILAGVFLVGCGSNTGNLFGNTGGAGGVTTTGTGASTASAGSGTGGMQSGSSGSGASTSSGANTTSSGSMSSSTGSMTTSGSTGSSTSSTSSSGGACGTCPGNEVCCASANPPHCYNPTCLSCCMSSGPSSSAASSASSTGGLPCPQPCGTNHTCCNGHCVDELVDIFNCGACGHGCGNTVNSHPYCDNGTCMDTPCQGIACMPSQFCCEAACCNLGELCCNGSGGQTPPTCKAAVNGTCPSG